MFKKVYTTFYSFFTGVRHYYKNSPKDIIRKNIQSLKTASLGGLLLLLLLIAVTPAIIEDWTPTAEYWSMIPTFALFAVFVFVYDRFFKPNYFVVQSACVLFCSLLLMHFVFISVYPYPSNPQSFLTVFFIIMPMFFIINPLVADAIMVLTIVIYYFLASAVKDPFIVPHDMFAAIMAAAFSQVCMFLVFSLRISDFYARETYKRQSRTDLLTGVLNKRSFENLCKRRFDHGCGPCALFMFDIDHFKAINDSHGHLTGDRVLEIFGNILLSEFGSDDLVGRVGGDEFCALMPEEPGSTPSAREKAAHLIEIFENKTSSDLGVKCTLSIGVAIVKNNTGATYDDMFSAADKSLYECKNGTGDKVSISNF